MKKPLLKTLVIIAAAATAASCSGPSGNSRSVKVESFVIDETIKTASQCYAFADQTLDMNGYASISASVMWPDKLGDSQLRALQDTIMARAFATTPRGQGIDSAMKKFVSSPEAFEFQDAKWTVVDSLPSNEAAERAWYIDVTARVAYLDEGMVTYQISNSSYMGGAHPNTVTDMFTYDLKNGKVLDSKNMFVPGSEARLLEFVKQQLADDLNTTVDKLSETGIFTEQMTGLGQPYLNGDAVVFHYNPYEIAPYSMGAFNIGVWASSIKDYLTPDVKALTIE